MMNIEGTAHEKALLVLFAYIIGFVSAFITFNYALPPAADLDMKIVKVDSTASVASVASAPVETTVVGSNIRAVYENNGLYVYGLQSEPVLLSKNIASTELTYDQLPTLADKQGFHSEIPAFEYFEQYGYLFFCEVYDDSDVCTPYLYDTERNVLRMVSVKGSSVEVSVAEARDVSMSGALGLQLGGYSSATLSRPWEVIGM